MPLPLKKDKSKVCKCLFVINTRNKQDGNERQAEMHVNDVSVSSDTGSPCEDEWIRWSLQDLDGAPVKRGEVRTKLY